MTADLTDLLAIGRSELVAFTGAGGKSTLMFRLAAELAARGNRVVVTTTTKMGADQAPDGATVCAATAPEVDAALRRANLVMAVATRDDHKVTGPGPVEAGSLLTATSADHLLVEADGSRGLPLNAPAAHEPVVPPEATLVVVCAGLDAVGRPFTEACHRPHLGAALAGRDVDARITVEDMAAVIGDPAGGLRGIPSAARVAVALTKANAGQPEAQRLRALLERRDRIDRVIVIPIGAVAPSRRKPGRSTGR